MGREEEKTLKDAIICKSSQGRQHKQNTKYNKDFHCQKGRKEVRSKDKGTLI